VKKAWLTFFSSGGLEAQGETRLRRQLPSSVGADCCVERDGRRGPFCSDANGPSAEAIPNRPPDMTETVFLNQPSGGGSARTSPLRHVRAFLRRRGASVTIGSFLPAPSGSVDHTGSAASRRWGTARHERPKEIAHARGHPLRPRTYRLDQHHGHSRARSKTGVVRAAVAAGARRRCHQRRGPRRLGRRTRPGLPCWAKDQGHRC